MDILRRYDKGKSTAVIHKALNPLESTLRTIRQNRKNITAAVKAGAGSSSMKVSSGQSNIMVRMEKMLVMWMVQRNCQGLNVTFDGIKNKAMDCYSYLMVKETSLVPEVSASTGWFYKFQAHRGSHNVKCSGEDKTAAAAFYTDRLGAIIKEGGYKPQQVFNIDGTGLQWKKLPECTYITREKSAPGFKAAKDHCKLKPILVYHAENPRAIKGYEKTSLPVALKGYEKTNLPVHWYASSTGWMMGHIFQACNRTALVHDNTPAQLHVLQDLHHDIKFVFLPPNTTSLLQPMDQGIIRMFKAHYRQRTWHALSLKCDVS